MARLCERPGCSQPADVLYGIDADHLLVWIESLDGAVVPRAGVLCRRHADAMVVPLGWMLDDRREPVPRLFKPRDAPPPTAARPRRHRSAVHRDETGQLELAPVAAAEPSAPSPTPPAEVAAAMPAAVEPAAAAEPQVEDAGVDDAGLPWKPVFDQRDDLDGLLVARSPLLSRAFGKREPPAGQ
jgi:hypothetical protein